MTPTGQDRKLEVALMELFCRSEEFGRVFLTCVSKEEFAKSVNSGALDHQQAAHEAMQLITADRKRVALEARLDENNMYIRELTRHYFPSGPSNPHIPLVQFHERIAELKAQQEEVK